VKICNKCKEPLALDCFDGCKTAPDGLQYTCKTCSKAQKASWYQKNRCRILAQAKNARAEDPCGIRAARAAYRNANMGRAREYSREYYRKHAEKVKRSAKKYRDKNPAIATAAQKRWRKINPEKIREYSRKRRANKSSVTVGPVDEAAIYELCGNRCAYCGSTKRLELDHIVALAAGGPHCESNLLVACRTCNSSKGTKPVAEWLATRPMTKTAA